MEKQILSEQFRRMQKLAGIIVENVEELQRTDREREGSNTQIMLRVKGRGLAGGELIISTEEFNALIKLAKEFAGNRNNGISKAVNTKDKTSTQSTIGIKPDGLNLELYRKESSPSTGYKGYDESDTGGELVTGGKLVAQQSVVYQLVNMEPAEDEPNVPDKIS